MVPGDPVPDILVDFGHSCEAIHQITSQLDEQAGYIGLTSSGSLLIAVSNATPRVLSSNVNSFCLASGLVVYTTTSHEAYFIAIDNLLKRDPGEELVTERRRVERGSRIVTAISSNMSLVLQMPRGNLETINPRPMILRVVRKDIEA